MNSACLPITISRSDPVYAPHNIKCMGFVRSHLIANNPYQVDIGEQVNAVTSYLDNSNIYGSDYKTMIRVRSFNGGRLKTNLKNVLPIENGTYFSGDDRVNQTPFLAIWHSIFLRNHNLIADGLGDLNRLWDDERLFQEARKINVAVYQKIVFDEWLPAFLGRSYCERFENVDYDPDVDSSTANEFAAAAFRSMHSFVNSEFQLIADDGSVSSLNLSDTVMNKKLLGANYDDILRGLLSQKMNLVGYAGEVLNKLFKNKKEIGLDLLSIDILRGRDHGLPPYHKFRKMCNLKSNIKVFNDLFPVLPASAIVQLRQTYKSVLDIDLLVGGALESIARVGNETDDDLGFFGPTFQCIIGEQFNRLKAGDSHFYTNNQFTEGEFVIFDDFSIDDFCNFQPNLRPSRATR